MKMVIVLAVCLALSAASASASALQMPWSGMHSPAGWLIPMMGAGAGGLYPGAAEYLRQPQCSPVASPSSSCGCGLGEQIMWPSRCQAMCGVAQQLQMMQLQLQLQLQRIAAASSLYGPAALMQQWQQLLPAIQALNPLAMVMAQVAQNMPTMCQQPGSYCTSTTPCAAAAIPPYY